jgi:hypothetical protein
MCAGEEEEEACTAIEAAVQVEHERELTPVPDAELEGTIAEGREVLARGVPAHTQQIIA